MSNLTSLHPFTTTLSTCGLDKRFIDTSVTEYIRTETKKMKQPKKKLIINYSDGSEYVVKNVSGFYIENSVITVGIKAHKVCVDKGITQHIGDSKLTIKKHLVDSLVEIDYDSKGNKVVKETQIKGQSYFDKK